MRGCIMKETKRALAALILFLGILIALALRFSFSEAVAIGIVGGADGPTAIYLRSRTPPWLSATIALFVVLSVVWFALRIREKKKR